MISFLFAFSVLAACPDTIFYAFAGHSNMENFFRRGGEAAFEKTMTALYPDQYFGSIRCAFASTGPATMKKGEPRFDHFVRRIKSAGKIGGLVLMYGFIEGKDSCAASSFFNDARRFISDIRDAADNASLPVFINRYEANNRKEASVRAYEKYSGKIDNSIEQLAESDRHCHLCPIRYMPAAHFAENHHYDSIGQWIFGVQLPAIIQFKKEDWWIK